LRHIGRPDRKGTRIHGQPPAPALLPQPGVHGWVTGGQQAAQTGHPQVAGGGLVTRGKPGQRPLGHGPGPVQLLIGPGDLDPQADDRVHRYGKPAAGQGQADDTTQRMAQHDGAGTGRDDTGDRAGEAVEGIRGERR